MKYNTSAAESQIVNIQRALGTVKTLDQTPPTFTHLEIEDFN